MSKSQQKQRYRYSVLERGCAIVMSCLFLAASLVSVVESVRNGQVGQLVISILFAGFTCLLLYVAITYRNLTDEQVADLQPRLIEFPGKPPLDPNAANWVVAIHVEKVRGRIQQCIVAVDLVEERIHFKDCFIPNKFWGGWACTTYATCQLNEVLSVPYIPNFDGPGGHLQIVTQGGKALLPDDATNYERMRRLLAEVSRETPPAAPLESPYLFVWAIVGAMMGMIGANAFSAEFTVQQSGLLFVVGAFGGGLCAVGLAWIWKWSR